MRESKNPLLVEKCGDVIVVKFTKSSITGEKDVNKVGDELYSLVNEQHHTKILLRFDNVEMVDSAFLGKMIVFNKKVREAGGKLVLCNMSDFIYNKLFKVTILYRVFNIHRDEMLAIREFY